MADAGTHELLVGEADELETSGDPDTTSETGRRMNSARLGDKCIDGKT